MSEALVDPGAFTDKIISAKASVERFFPGVTVPEDATQQDLLNMQFNAMDRQPPTPEEIKELEQYIQNNREQLQPFLEANQLDFDNDPRILGANELLLLRAAKRGAAPGVALTPDQEESLWDPEGGLIMPAVQTLPETATGMEPVPPVESLGRLGSFLRGVGRGGVELTGGMAQTGVDVGEATAQTVAGTSSDVGREARKLSQQIAIGDTLDEVFYDQRVKDHPYFGIGGEVVGNILALPVGIASKLGAFIYSAILGGSTVEQGKIDAELDESRLAQSAKERGTGAATSAGFGLGGQMGLDYLANKTLGRQQKKAAKEMDVDLQDLDDTLSHIKKVDDASRVTGIPIFPAQKTGDTFQLERQSFLATLSSASRKALREIKNQNEKAGLAVENLLFLTAPAIQTIDAPVKAWNAAKKLLEKEEKIRQINAGPLFDQVWAEGGTVDIWPLLKKADAIMNKYGPNHPAYSMAKSFMNDVTKRNTMEQFHALKEVVDNRLDTMATRILANPQKNRALNKANREAVKLKGLLRKEMIKANPTYGKALKAFEDLSGPLDFLRDSAFGLISKLKPHQLKSVSGMIFDPNTANPATIATMRNLFDEADPYIWDALVRSEMQKRLNKVKIDLIEQNVVGGQQMANVPSMIVNNLFGNKGQQDVLFSALRDGPQKQFAEALLTASQAAASGRPGGSQTAIREEIKKKMRGIALTFKQMFMDRPANRLLHWGDEAMFDRNARVLAEVVFNPDWQPDIADLMKNYTGSPKDYKKLRSLLGRVALAVEDEMLEEETPND